MEFAVFDSIEPIARDWDGLATLVLASPFLRPGWFQAWWDSFGRGRLAILTATRDGRLVGVAPLYRHHGALLALANVHSPHFAFLATDASVRRSLAEAVFAGNPLHTAVCFADAEEGSMAETERVARTAGRRLLTITIQRSPYVEIRGAWEEYEVALSSKFVRDLHRRRRQLESHGEVTVEIADGSEDLDALLVTAFDLEASGWKEQRGTAIVSSPATRRFYEEVARWAASRGILRLAFLRVGDRRIAFEYALEDAGRWYFLKGGVDPEMRRFGAGKLLVHDLLERAFRAGLVSFEFLGADEEWKRDWKPAYRELRLQHTFRPSPVGIGLESVIASWRLVSLPLARRVLGWAG